MFRGPQRAPGTGMSYALSCHVANCTGVASCAGVKQPGMMRNWSCNRSGFLIAHNVDRDAGKRQVMDLVLGPLLGGVWKGRAMAQPWPFIGQIAALAIVWHTAMLYNRGVGQVVARQILLYQRAHILRLADTLIAVSTSQDQRRIPAYIQTLAAVQAHNQTHMCTQLRLFIIVLVAE